MNYNNLININYQKVMIFSRRVNSELLIKKYFQQLTSGCGRPNCSNKQCVSGGFNALPCNQAAAMAIKFLFEKAQICENNIGNKKSFIVFFNVLTMLNCITYCIFFIIT